MTALGYEAPSASPPKPEKISTDWPKKGRVSLTGYHHLNCVVDSGHRDISRTAPPIVANWDWSQNGGSSAVRQSDHVLKSDNWHQMKTMIPVWQMCPIPTLHYLLPWAIKGSVHAHCLFALFDKRNAFGNVIVKCVSNSLMLIRNP